MKRNSNQLAFEFATETLAPSNHFTCEHNFYCDSETEHQVCDKCGLCIPHEYIIEKCDLADWPDDE